MGMTLKQMVEEYVALREKRMELEHQAEEIKQGKEAELKRLILLEMSSQGLKTANFEGLGRVTSKNRNFYEVQDMNLFARGLLTAMIAAGNQGRPLADGLFVQKRVNAEALETLLEENQSFSMEQFGIGQVTRQELSVTKR